MALAFGFCRAGLARLLQSESEETLHLVLEALTPVIQSEPEAAVQYESHITPLVLQVWQSNVADPLLAEDATEVVTALAKIPTVLPQLQVRSAYRCQLLLAS